ncbi:polyprenyl synthetase family protein [Solitalea koreensis]|uniref:Geranylgeranyl diphosphate synthase, type II n=1 Tax=Solitalea koreensis TaxID=543615 RepID=A0A521BR53_9SPHI|nr:polyprenyl synthetase family protein [Solitalea koreensis]SMO49589.1 geranylgeranyl diphosphate synthase, type II [Solitalea koreensis]
MKIKELQHLINTEVEQLALPGNPGELYEPITYLMALGGKRMRPVLTLMACNVFSEDVQPALKAALGIEVFHNFSLMHDDIMDNAPLRRGKKTVHEKWNPNIAILSGDVMLVKAYELMMQVDDHLLRTVLDIFNKTAAEVCEGQQMDMNFEGHANVEVEQYIEMIGLKTAVLLGASLKIGALIGGAAEAEAQHLYEFGKNLGIAFQLQDDILDVFGDPDKFGKQVGGDIIANKKTYLLIKAIELAEHSTKDELKHWINIPIFDADEKVKAVTNIYNQLNIREQAENMMHSFVVKAMDHINCIEVTPERKKQLIDFAGQLMVREH